MSSYNKQGAAITSLISCVVEPPSDLLRQTYLRDGVDVRFTKMSYTKECPVCGGEITAKDNHQRAKQKTCSPSCGAIFSARRVPIKDRLLSRVKKNPTTGCWEWVGGCTKKGYGVLRITTAPNKSSGQKVHRVAYEIFRGPILEGLRVLHKCDNPPCVNPNHLFLGTPADNTKDMVEKGRTCSPLTIAAVREIRKALVGGESQQKIAVRFNVSQCTINNINIGHTWRHIK